MTYVLLCRWHISAEKRHIFLFTEFFSLTECTELTEILMVFYYPIAEGDEGEACDEAEAGVGDEATDVAVLEHL